MGNSQRRTVENDRTHLCERGLARFEVLGREADLDLIRSLGRRLAEEGPEASRLRAVISQWIAGEPSISCPSSRSDLTRHASRG
jgi:hypothetical protein